MPYTSKSKALIAISVILPVFAALTVAARIRCRNIRNVRLAADDYWIILALFITTAASIPYIIGACIGGVGEHLKDVSEETGIISGKIIFAVQFFYIFSVAPIKISVLCFYKRIFFNQTFRRVANGIILFVLLWTISFFFATLFQAWPISYNWTGIGTSTDYDIIYYVCSGTDILADLVTVCLPIPMIKGLQLSTAKKWRITGILWIGAFCTVSSAIRLYYLTTILHPSDLTDITYQTANIVLWSAIEPSSSIICACLPTLGPLFASGRTPESMVRSVRSVFSIRSKSSVAISGERKGSQESGSALGKDITVTHSVTQQTEKVGV